MSLSLAARLYIVHRRSFRATLFMLAMLFEVICGGRIGGQLHAQGTILQANGPVNRGMGGASVAAPVDVIGATYWNPASIGAFTHSESAFSVDVLFPNHTVSSAIGPWSGSTEADAGAFPLPNVALVHPTEFETLTLGLGVHSVAGFGTNLPADPTNPILAPEPTGLGQVNSNAFFMQIAPIAGLRLSEDFWFGFGPTIATARLSVEPFVFGDANADGTYTTAHGTRYHWGGGFQLGTFYEHSEHWRFGFSLRSPIWMENFEFNGEDQNGQPRKLVANLDLPLILSIGTAFQPNQETLFALDVRYFDFANTDGLGDSAAYSRAGALAGLDFSSVMSMAVGVQRRFNDLLVGRVGYTYNQNPIKNSEAFYNIASPVIYQHMLSGGGSLALTGQLSFDLAYSYYFENTRSGQIVLPGIGTVPGSRFENTVDVHLFSIGFTLKQ